MAFAKVLKTYCRIFDEPTPNTALESSLQSLDQKRSPIYQHRCHEVSLLQQFIHCPQLLKNDQ